MSYVQSVFSRAGVDSRLSVDFHVVLDAVFGVLPGLGQEELLERHLHCLPSRDLTDGQTWVETSRHDDSILRGAEGNM